MNYELQKRVLDVTVALILIILFLPFWIIIPILVMIDSGWPVFFTHTRVGKGGKPIQMYKFRSMVKNADQLLHQQDRQLLEKFKSGDWKLENDPRITRLGKVLRSLTIDEFPQLLNVLQGDMSMVGPRAYVEQELQEQTARYPETKKYVQQILKIKPGITGLWQVSGRNDVPFRKRVQLDAKYAQERSILTDLKILAKTPKAMISRW